MESVPDRDFRPLAGRDPLRQAVQFLGLILPILLTFFYVYSMSVEIPWFDDWDVFVPAFQHQAEGNLQWSDINAQHNESIVAVPVAASLVLAKISGGRLLSITYLSYMFLCGALGVLLLFFRELNLPGRWSGIWFLPAAFLFLGWRQWEGLLWSTHLLNTMAIFFTLASLYCCIKVARAPIFFPAAIAFGWMASFSMASGTLVWLSGAIALLFAEAPGMRFVERIRLIVGWLVVGGVCVLCFFFDLARYQVPWPTGFGYVLANPLTAVRYALTYLGGPLADTARPAMFAGLALVLIGIPIVFIALRKHRTTPAMLGLLPAIYLATALVPVVSGRLGLGVTQAVASRYVTVAALGPIGIYFCSLALARTVPACRFITAALILLLVYGIWNSYSSGLIVGRQIRSAKLGCAAAIKNFEHVDSKVLLCGYPDSSLIIQRAPALERYHLSLFGQ